MTENQDWRASLTASERYDNVEKIQKAIAGLGPSGLLSPTPKDAFTVENEAYKNAASRREYEDACTLSPVLGARPDAQEASSPPFAATGVPDVDDEPGVRIGPYEDCHYVASGVTAEVYRCKHRALKVITESRGIEPHNPFREAKILAELKKPCIQLLETFRDQEQRFTLVFPYMPLTLAALVDKGSSLTDAQLRTIFTDMFAALAHIHDKGIIHRDIKPSALLLASTSGPAYLSDFGIAWHPRLSESSEPAAAKILDIGTGPYRAPEVLFGDRAYGPAVDMWGAGTTLAECARRTGGPARPLFESRAAHEDGNQLGLILSIFKTLGTPTPGTWPEAAAFRTPPFEMYAVFEGRPWEDVLPDVQSEWRELVARLVRYESGSRATAEQALQHGCFKNRPSG
ncbi:Serine/threonine-protein kinase csk1 [Pleurostoma richardsiae]|uniref:cyclin-dependent kinase n=1 Tax=Pleurostoma richardsiae TaxID=41990 RepID=A0AA38VWS2_9PEZI|nr:Serine/threonine-protein kinase csk1 [Pleurostoma richardsiae]